MIFLNKGTALGRDKPLYIFLYVFAEVRRILKLFWDYALFFIIINGATAVPSSSNKVSGSYCRSYCVKEE